MHQAHKPVRVRFAPSPTGYLHIGGLRSALFNWLFARHHGGAFLLRIEDTDTERSQEQYIQAITDALRWCSLDIDDSIVYQSQRTQIYQRYMQQLLDNEWAYWSPAHEEAYGTDVVRFRVPRDRSEISFYDAVRGTITVPIDEIDDFPLARSDGSPLYNFVAVVDDVEMRISHVIRGEDHISNTPKQVLLYEALQAQIPTFAHVPLILGPSGERLSKRDAATSTLVYRDRGFLPDALCNYMVRLGWSHYDQEIFTRDELIQYFSLEGIRKSAAIFDYDKLLWMNSAYMKQHDPEKLVAYIDQHLDTTWRTQLYRWTDAQVRDAVALYQHRDDTLIALRDHVKAVHDRPSYGDIPNAVPWQEATSEYLEAIAQRLPQIEPFTADQIKQEIKALCGAYGIKLPMVAKPVRFAVTGQAESPSIFELIYILGADEVAYRCRALKNAYTR